MRSTILTSARIVSKRPSYAKVVYGEFYANFGDTLSVGIIFLKQHLHKIWK